MGSLKWCANYRLRQINKRRAMQIVKAINKQMAVVTPEIMWGQEYSENTNFSRAVDSGSQLRH